MKKLLLLLVFLLVGCNRGGDFYDECSVTNSARLGLEYHFNVDMFYDVEVLEDDETLTFKMGESLKVYEKENISWVCNTANTEFKGSADIEWPSNFRNRNDLQILFNLNKNVFANDDVVVVNTIINSQENDIIGHLAVPTEIIITDTSDVVYYSNSLVIDAQPVIYKNYDGVSSFNFDIDLSELDLEPGEYIINYSMLFEIITNSETQLYRLTEFETIVIE